jgi:hypothetical protein
MSGLREASNWGRLGWEEDEVASVEHLGGETLHEGIGLEV